MSSESDTKMNGFLKTYTKYLLACTLAGALLVSAAYARIHNPCEPKLSVVQHRDITASLVRIGGVLAEDALQEALISHSVECNKGTVILNPIGWIKTVSRNKLLNLMRNDRLKLHKESSAHGLGLLDGFDNVDWITRPDVIRVPQELLTSKSSKDYLRKIIAKHEDAKLLVKLALQVENRLTLDQLRVLNRSINGEQTAAEIAAAENVPISTVQSRLRSSTLGLKDLIKRSQPDVQSSDRSLAGFWRATGTLGHVIMVALMVSLFGIGIVFTESPERNEGSKRSHAPERSQPAKSHEVIMIRQRTRVLVGG